jgi:type II secretion system protein G
MSISKFAARRRGFTLIELLIVIVVIAILALIVIPKLMNASRLAKEASLKANLTTLRHATEQFSADCGDYPSGLDQLTVAAGGVPTLANGTTCPAGVYKGPYLTGQGGVGGGSIPLNPFASSTVNQTTADAWVVGTAVGTGADAWVYNETGDQGMIYSGVNGTCLDGTPFAEL